jgi:hypothetical protein
MIGTAKEGGTITIYSSRFTLTGMTGAPSASIQKAITALGGSTTGPKGVDVCSPSPTMIPLQHH